MYVIQFKERGVETNVWSGYVDYSEALRAVRDADLIIPPNWTWDIITEEKLAQQYEEEYYQKIETA